MTGDWEKKLRLIEKGEYDAEVFKAELYKMVRELTDEVIFNTHQPIQLVQEETEKPKVASKPKVKKPKVEIEDLDCPKCKSNKLMKGKTALGCSNFKECGFKVPFYILGKKLSDNNFRDLIQKGKTTQIKGLKKPGAEEAFAAVLKMTEDFNIDF